MILLTYSTKQYRPLTEKYLFPSSKSFEIVHIEEEYPLCQWNTPTFNLLCQNKVEAIVKMINHLSDGEIFIYCDGDIELFGLTPEMVFYDLKDSLIAAHSDNLMADSFCTGLLFLKCSPITRDFCSRWMNMSKENNTEDQQWFNFLLKKENICRRLSSKKYWNIGQLGITYDGNHEQLELIKFSIPKTTIMFHANYAIGMQHKMELLDAVHNVIFSL